jgi:hypothetical protein
MISGSVSMYARCRTVKLLNVGALGVDYSRVLAQAINELAMPSSHGKDALGSHIDEHSWGPTCGSPTSTAIRARIKRTRALA